jgi:hypothetical protein
MRRREFITFLGGTAVRRSRGRSWRAQQPQRMRRIGVFVNLASDKA